MLSVNKNQRSVKDTDFLVFMITVLTNIIVRYNMSIEVHYIALKGMFMDAHIKSLRSHDRKAETSFTYCYVFVLKSWIRDCTESKRADRK